MAKKDLERVDPRYYDDVRRIIKMIGVPRLRMVIDEIVSSDSKHGRPNVTAKRK